MMKAISCWCVAVLCIAPIEAQGADATQPSVAIVHRDFYTPDVALWGDGLQPLAAPTPQKPPYAFRNDYVLDIPTTGWYEVYFVKAGGGLRHDLFVDGELAWRFANTDTTGKAGNLWLKEGKRTLRIQRLGRVGYPARGFDRLELRPAMGRPEASILAAKTEVDVMRVGEPFRVRLTAGGAGQAVTYELLRTDLLYRDQPPQPVMTIDFAASDEPITKMVDVPCPVEGAFALVARVNGETLTESEFQARDFAVVNVKQPPIASSETEVVYDIDCVAQTINGRPVLPDAFVECNGPTRVTESKAGAYRESHDCTPPFAAVPPTPLEEPASFSGFSYRVELPKAQVPYLVEVDFPDDSRRSVTVLLNSIDPKTGGFLRDAAGYGGKSYETGGMFPLTGQMQKHRAINWPRSTPMLIGVMSQSPGHRAAVARIRVLRFKDDKLPLPATPQTAGGRNYVHWYEESGSWRHMFGVNDLPEGIVQEFVGLDRWAQMARFYGANGLSALGIGYQGAFYRATQLDGMMPSTYDACRLAALVCEKYGMTYMPEVYCTQSYMENLTFRERTGNNEDFRAFNCHGGKEGSGAAPCTLNPLHPVVQETWIKALGELADKLRDSSAFRGITVRDDEWGFRSQFAFPSIYWGYGDWTIRQFDKDLNLVVTGGPNDPNAPAIGDPQRFIQRYAFLSSPEHRQQWINWRNARILDYHTRIRDRIRGERKDLLFAIAGGFKADPLYRQADTMQEAAIGAGVDIDQRRAIDGLPIIPIGSYGTRYTTAVEQARYGQFFDEENVHAGMGSPRMFSAYMVYQELARYWPAAALGVKVSAGQKVPYYCSAVLAAGRHSLEKFAVVLAEQDTAILRDGGNTDIFGDPETYNPWLNEFKAIPAVPFEPFDEANDPVAVWHRQIGGGATGGGYYFYAVNREPYPVTIRLALKGATSITRLGTAEHIDLHDGALTLALQPYELRSFFAPTGATLVGATTTVPEDRIQFVRDRIAFAQDLWQRFNGPLAGTLDEEQLKAYHDYLTTAWDALAKGRYWRARVSLNAAPMRLAYEKIGALPEGQVVTRFPRLMQAVPRAGHWNLTESMLSAEQLASAAPLTDGVHLVASTDFNPEWGGAKVLSTDGDALDVSLDIPADGRYALHVGHVAKTVGTGLAEIDGRSLDAPLVSHEAGAPDVTIYPAIDLKAGKRTLRLHRPGGIGIYAMKLLPALRPMGDNVWAVAGPFPSSWNTDGESGEHLVKQTLERVYPPEQDAKLDSVYRTDDGRQIRWTMPQAGGAPSEIWDRGVAMSMRVGSVGRDVNYGLTHITSDRDQTVQLYMAADWWARAYLNGERVLSNIDPKVRDVHGADFTTFYPSFFAVLHLKRGVNTLMVKQHGGSMGSCFVAFITDDPGIKLSATPPSLVSSSAGSQQP